MKELKEIIHLLDFKKVSTNESFYRFKDLEQQLLQLDEPKIIVSDSILTPYYISNNLVYELYEYELNISIVNEFNLEKFLLHKTGKSKIDEIPNNIIKLYDKCYIEVLNSVGNLSVKDLQDYIKYLYNENSLISQVNQYFNEFSTENLFFLYY